MQILREYGLEPLNQKKKLSWLMTASIKLKGKDSPRNLPNEPVFETESYFQNHFTDKEVVEMIKDHSYDEKLQ